MQHCFNTIWLNGSPFGRTASSWVAAGKAGSPPRARYLVSQHADVEAKIAAELDGQGLLASAQRPRPRTMACEDLARLPYLSWVIKVLPRLLLGFLRHQCKE